MPGRQSTGLPSLRNPRPKKQKAKRSLNALAIAEKEVPSKTRIRKNRLGESEPQNAPKRKRRDEDEGQGSGDEPAKRPRRTQNNEEEVEMGSDSSGNEWMVGQVDNEDDSDLDSDEAMGESDEERFEGYTFRGSSSQKAHSKKSRETPTRNGDVGNSGDFDLAERDGDESNEDNFEDFGDEGVDLATMLDEESEEMMPKEPKQKASEFEEESYPGDEDSGFETEESGLSISDNEDDVADASKLASLQTLVSTMNTHDQPSTQSRRPDAQESMTPSEFGLNPTRKLTVADLAPSVTDPQLKRSLRFLADSDSKSASKRGGIPKKLDVPLPKRQQDRIDRMAAYEKSKETLNRWIDTVKHNRRAEHLSFPLRDPDASVPQGQNRLLPNTQSKPITDLESTIQSILQDSGLSKSNGRSDEQQLQAFEELKTNKMPIEEVLARRAELRQQRELLFREEVRAKRIKKIKSKTYRKIHRKERERNAAHLRDAMAADGQEESESDKERNDRRRAEERMGARHRESKWAKSIKDTGRAKWDDDAREGVNEMVRRGDELKRRMEGKIVRGEDDSGISSDDGGSDDFEDEDTLRRSLEKLVEARDDDQDASKTGRLSSMAFMKRAEAGQKTRNDADAESLRRDLAGEDTPSEEEDTEGPGRKLYGPQMKRPEKGKKTVVEKSELEEREESDFEDQDRQPAGDADTDRVEIHANPHLSARPATNAASIQGGLAKGQASGSLWNAARKAPSSDSLSKTILTEKTHTTTSGPPRSALKGARAAEKKEQKAQGPEPALVHPVGHQDPEEIDEEDSEQQEPVVFRNAELAKRAFAGDDVVDRFLEEKADLIHEQEDQVIDNTLPGWGTWVGEGIGKKASKPRPRHREITKVKGIAPENRKDAKLKDVIISEKRVKKNGKYLAGQLPHPFETRAQYERSLRLPVGPEWTTKETFQNMTKPRVLMKQGIIAAMAKPVV